MYNLKTLFFYIIIVFTNLNILYIIKLSILVRTDFSNSILSIVIFFIIYSFYINKVFIFFFFFIFPLVLIIL